MEGNTAASPLITLIMFAMISVLVAIIANKLAREKGRNVTLWTILGCIPMINFICLQYFIGAANLKLEEKIDKLLSQSE